ncbi:MAG: AmmeMemoRadiSam system protein A [Patescibacteria group bacterium]
MNNYTNLAKKAIEECIKYNKIMKVPDSLPKDFYNRKAGVFVTIFNGKELRGCIGTFLPTRKNIAEEIISNAVAACSRDYRFSPITKDELPKLNYEVSILSEPKPVEDIKNHNPKKHGIIVQCSDRRCGLLLPDLGGIDLTEQQIDIACQKGDIDPLKDNFSLFEFTVEKYK